MTRTENAPTNRTRLRRMHDRGGHDAASIYPILDATPLCTVAYVIDDKPYATPTVQWREGDHVYWHGSSASRMLKKSVGHQVCLSVAITDGFVMARSAMHHSVNYRSAMLFGEAWKVEDRDEKEARLKIFVDGLFPGRWDILRSPSPQEMKATTVLGMKIDEAASKIRMGQPVDEDADYDLPIWAGVLPTRTEFLAPVADPKNLAGVEMPDHIRNFRFGS